MDLALRVQVVQTLEDLPQDGGDGGLLQGARFQLEKRRGQQGLGSPTQPHSWPGPRPHPSPREVVPIQSGGLCSCNCQARWELLSQNTAGEGAPAGCSALGCKHQLLTDTKQKSPGPQVPGQSDSPSPKPAAQYCSPHLTKSSAEPPPRYSMMIHNLVLCNREKPTHELLEVARGVGPPTPRWEEPTRNPSGARQAAPSSVGRHNQG